MVLKRSVASIQASTTKQTRFHPSSEQGEEADHFYVSRSHDKIITNLGDRVTVNSATTATLWSADEHERFIEGLEKHVSGQSTNPAATWRAITLTVETKSLSDVRAHAQEYYMRLQAVNAEKRKEYVSVQQIDTRWSMYEDTLFEELLAQYSDGISYPWEVIASQLPGKTALDIQERYQQLCYDVSRIEAGQHIMMNLGRNQRPYERSPVHVSDINCIVTLRDEEVQMLLEALHHVSVPSHTSPEVLAAIASAVAALARSTNKRPPQRSEPHYAIRNARQTLEHVIHLGLTDPYAVLQILVREIQLAPGPPPPNLNHSRTPITTVGVEFGVSPTSLSMVHCGTSGMPPPPSHVSYNYPQDHDDPTCPAAHLILLRRSPVHLDAGIPTVKKVEKEAAIYPHRHQVETCDR